MATQQELFDRPPLRLPEGMVYREDFLAPDEEAGLLAHIAELPLHEAR